MNRQFSDLLQSVRLRPSRVKKKRDLSEEVLSDSGRIIPSPPFRRLQSKAQVFSLEINAGVRTRLTHSMEVALYGRILAGQVFRKLCERQMIAKKLQVPFISTVENACLLHDIGNPPFGHFGEFTIQAWFSDREIGRQLAKVPEPYFSDLQKFDGNSQGFRIISRLSWAEDEYGLNLTCSLLLSYLKYGSDGFTKKRGFFTVDKERVKGARDKLGLQTQRFPLTFLMEACDDIAYCLSDIEDGIEKGLTDFRTMEEYLDDRVKSESQGEMLSTLLSTAKDIDSSICGTSLRQKTKFLKFKIALVRSLINMAETAFVDNCGAILDGSHRRPLLSTDEGTVLGELRNFAKDYLFSSKEAYDLELLSNAVIKGLLESFLPLLKMRAYDFQRVLEGKTENGKRELEKRLCMMLPGRHVQNYRWQTSEMAHPEPALRAHLLLDYISGMTDTYALEVFQILNGVKATARA